MVNVGVIGYGYWGPNLVRNCQESDVSCVTMVSDLDEVLQRALAAGGRLDRDIRRSQADPVGRCDVANLSDPAGNGVDLVERHI